MSERKIIFTEKDVQAIENVFEKIDPRCIWSKLKRNDFTFHRFPTGMVNDVTHCKLTPEARKRLCHTERDFPEVVVKFFTTNPRFPYCPIQRVIINTLASIYDLSPHIIFIDENVSVQQCIINARIPNEKDDFDFSFFEQTARKIARFHCMPVPISTNFEKWKRFLEECKTSFPFSSKILDGSFKEIFKNDPSFKEHSTLTLMKLDFKKIYEYFFSEKLEIPNSPIVFAHLDFHRDNRIIQEKIDPETGVLTKKLFFIDLDFAMFYFRGIDLGVYFESYGQKEYRFGQGPLPKDDKILEFIHYYRDECSKILGKSYLEKSENSIEKILAETKVYVLYSYFLAIWIALNNYFDVNNSLEAKQNFGLGAIIRANQFVEYRDILDMEGILPAIDINFYC